MILKRSLVRVGWSAFYALTLLGCARAQLTLDTDSRLDAHITARVAGVSIKALLSDWSKQSGVSLSADASIRDQRAFARLVNRPLRDGMRLLAAAFGYEWRIVEDEPDAPPRYVLQASPQIVQQQNLLRHALHQNCVPLLQRALREIPESLLSLDYEAFCQAVGRTPIYEMYQRTSTDAEIVDPEPDPNYAPLIEPSFAPLEDYDALVVFALRRELLLQASQNPHTWLILHLLLRTPPTFWAQLASVGEASLPPPELPEPILRAYEQAKAREESAWAEYREHLESLDAQARLESAEVAPDEIMEVPDDDASMEQLSPEVEAIILSVEQAEIEDKLCANYLSPLQSLKITLCIKPESYAEVSLSLGTALWSLYETDPEDEPDALSEAFQQANYTLRPIDDPRWTNLLQRNWTHWSAYAIVEGLESAGIEGVGEFYPLKFYPVLPVSFVGYSAVENLADLLDVVRREYFYHTDSGCFVFKARARPLARLYDVPDYLLARWTQITEPSLEWAAEVASRLAPEQVQSLRSHFAAAHAYMETTRRRSDQQSTSSNDLLASVQPEETFLFLRWYAQLPMIVQRRLQAGKTVNLSDLPPSAREGLLSILEARTSLTPCEPDIVRFIQDFRSCPQVTMRLVHNPDVVVRAEQYDVPSDDSPPQRMLYTERAQRWQLEVRANECVDGASRTTTLSYEVVTERAAKPLNQKR